MRGITESNNNGSPTSSDAHPMNDYKAQIEAILGEPATGSRGQGGLPVTGTVTDWEMHFTKAGKEHLVASLLKVITQAKIEELEALLPQPGEIIPYKRDKFAIGVQYIQNRVEARLAELKDKGD